MADTTTTITPKPNGPLLVQGPIRILAPDGTELAVPPRKDGRPAEVVVLCRCGGSATKPFCDGTHKRIGFCDTPPPPRSPELSTQYYVVASRAGGLRPLDPCPCPPNGGAKWRRVERPRWPRMRVIA